MIGKVRLVSLFVIVIVAAATMGLATSAPARQVNEVPKGDSVAIRGQVLDPDGEPVRGAQIILGMSQTGPADWPSPRRLVVSGADGRFEAALPRASLTPSRPNSKAHSVIVAFAAGFGPAWVRLDLEGTDKSLTLRLRRDDVPIDGRVINLEGRPVQGLTVYLASLMELPAELLTKVRENAGKPTIGLFWDDMDNAPILGKGGPIVPVRTGIDGRFRMTGVGRDQAALLLIEGEPFAQSFAVVYTSPDPSYKPLVLPQNEPSLRKLLGPRFESIVVLGRVLEGVIRDFDTGRHIRGATVRSAIIGSTISDDQGRFRIPGQPKMPTNFVAVSIAGLPYVKVEKMIGDPPGWGPIRVDITLKRGVWVEGKVTNRAAGKPVKAVIQYYPNQDNPYLEECPDATFRDNDGYRESEVPTDADGRFRAIALPGGGVLAVRTVRRDYLTAQPILSNDPGNVFPYAVPYVTEQYQGLVPIDFARAEKVTIPDVVVEQRRDRPSDQRTQHVKVIGLDGKPVTEIRVFGNLMRNPNGRGWSGGEFTFVHSDAGRDEPILVVNSDETAGALITVKGNEPDPVSITLQPAGTVTGRLVDDAGRPRSDVSFIVMQDLETTRGDRYPGEPPTGPDGRFRIRGLVAGVSYSVVAISKSNSPANRLMCFVGKPQWTIKPGESQDWGDVRLKKYPP